MSLRVRPSFPACGEMVSIRYKLRRGVSAKLEAGDQFCLVGGQGKARIQAREQPFDISLTNTDDRSILCKTRIEPWFVIPRLSRLRWAASQRFSLRHYLTVASPVSGDGNILDWKITRASTAHLEVTQGSNVIYKGSGNRHGRIVVALQSTDDVNVSLTAMSYHRNWQVKQQFTRHWSVHLPEVGFDYVQVPKELVYGERAVVRWGARNAQSVEVCRDGNRAGKVYPPVGASTVSAQSTDTLGLELIAKPLLEKAGIPDRSATEIRLIRVKHPGISIKLNSNTLRGMPGTRAQLTWAITGSKTSWIDAPSRRQRARVPPNGTIAVDIHLSTETITIFAENATGETEFEQVTITPDLYRHMH